METEFLQGTELDLHGLLQQQYFLALPFDNQPASGAVTFHSAFSARA